MDSGSGSDVEPTGPSQPARSERQPSQGNPSTPSRLVPTYLFSLPVVLGIAPTLGSVGTLARLAFAIAGIALLLLSRRRSRRLSPLDQMLLIAFAMIVALGVLGSPSTPFGVVRVANWMMFAPSFFLARQSKIALHGLANGLVASAFVQALGIALQVFGIVGGTWGGLALDGPSAGPAWLTRYTGFAQNPNDAAMFLGFGIIAAGLTGRFSDRKLLPLRAGCGVTLVGALVLTGSRGGILGLAIAWTIASLSLGRRAAVTATVTIAGAWLVASTIFGNNLQVQTVMHSIPDIVTGEDYSANSRLHLWEVRMNSQRNPLLGDGFGSYGGSLIQSGSDWNLSNEQLRLITTDNSWLKMYLELGLFGVLTYGLICLRALSFGLLNMRTSRHRLLLSTALLMLVWRSLSADTLDINPWNGIMWAVLGALLDPGERRRA